MSCWSFIIYLGCNNLPALRILKIKLERPCTRDMCLLKKEIVVFKNEIVKRESKLEEIEDARTQIFTIHHQVHNETQLPYSLFLGEIIRQNPGVSRAKKEHYPPYHCCFRLLVGESSSKGKMKSLMLRRHSKVQRFNLSARTAFFLFRFFLPWTTLLETVFFSTWKPGLPVFEIFFTNTFSSTFEGFRGPFFIFFYG